MSISSPSARPHSKSLFRGTVEMPQKALCGEFYQPTCHVSVLRVSSVQRPLQRVCGRGVNSPDFCGNSLGYFDSFRRPLQEKCRGVPYEFCRFCQTGLLKKLRIYFQFRTGLSALFTLGRLLRKIPAVVAFNENL